MVLVNSRNFTDFHRSSEPLEPLGFVGLFGLTRAGSWEGATSKCASTETSLAASRSTLQQLSIGIGRGAFTQVWSKVERFQVTRVHLKTGRGLQGPDQQSSAAYSPPPVGTFKWRVTHGGCCNGHSPW